MKIEIAFDETIFGDAAGMDIPASGEKYRLALTATLQEKFPNDEVEVRFDANEAVHGGTEISVDTDDDGELDEYMDAIFLIRSKLFEESEEWTVSKL